MPLPAAAIALFLLLTAGDDGNLLRNPGFEAVANGQPESWDVFVMEDPLARGGVEEATACEGSRSVYLENPEQYPREPYNNWSQCLTQDLAGRKVRARGFIKTAEATGAAVWLQCWRHDPPRVIAVQTTAEHNPVSGTKDWTPVELEMDVPSDTGFLVLRCVLKGKGKAWFDALELKEVPKEEPAKEVPAATKDAEKPAPPPAPNDASPATEEVRQLQESMDASIQDLMESNASLLQQVAALQDEVRDLRRQITALEPGPAPVPPLLPAPAPVGAPKPPAAAPKPRRADGNAFLDDIPTRPRRVPPLVPRGYKFEDN